ncbi:SDR family NAD(P)-dependent oxidoreductase [Mycolicibacterium mengxianglii]|uniref:SDR family NAD(P)-dependent oxidoreductase n=1 Tax=Mycolicibacterium mengxianglii TaxID=2736649 RepID=UPI0018D02336|nr:SDR family NAD(P)-dependent oxidoreductase [Mycolicibacterium mengxianglii]
MKIRHGDVALITGSSRGLGRHIALALAGRGMNVVLAARSQDGLDTVAAQVRAATGVTVSTVVVDLADRTQAASLVQRATEVAGPVDVLVNNAGIESTCQPEEAELDDLGAMTDVNLLAPMLLTRTVLPSMIERGRGHVVNVSSMAGLVVSPYEEPYSATKAGLIAYTRALRMTAQDRGWNLSASVICPGFMADEEGMYADMQSEFGASAPRSVGDMPAGAVGKAVVDAVEKDLPDVLVMPGAPRVFALASIATPRLFERIARSANLGAPFRTVAEQRSAQRKAGS